MTTQYLFDDADSFRNMAYEYAASDNAVQKVGNMTDEEILDLINKHIDETQIAEIFSAAQDAALTEIEQTN